MNISKDDMVEYLSTQVKGISKVNIEKILNATIRGMISGFLAGHSIQFRGFGTFWVDTVTRGKWLGGPALPAERKTVRFTASEDLRKKL